MFETVYLTSAEKREFLHEFAQNVMAALKDEQLKKAFFKEEALGRKTDLGEKVESKEAFEKSKLITRQFPGFGAVVKPVTVEVTEESIETPESVESEEQFLTLNDKIDSLLNDAAIGLIECSDGVVKISKGAGSEETGFILTEEESKSVIEKFSEKAKIPVNADLFKAKIRNLTIIAIVSGFIGNRFLIVKG